MIVWQKAHGLVLQVYKATRRFPRAELFGLTSQLRRAVVSIAANVAEGFKKRGRADKMRFLNIAQGSLEETRYYLILAGELGYIDSTTLINGLEEVSKLLEAYIRSMRNSGF